MDSLLYNGRERPLDPAAAFWQDCGLDRLITAICGGDDRLRRAWEQLPDGAQRLSRQQLFRDLEEPAIREPVESLLEAVRTLDRARSRQIPDPWQSRWLEARALLDYGRTLQEAEARLRNQAVRSPGMALLQRVLTEETAEQHLAAGLEEGERILQALSQVQICIRTQRGLVEVTRDRPEPDYSQILRQTFSDFLQPDAAAYAYTRGTQAQRLDLVEEQLVAGAAALFPAEFSGLESFCRRHQAPISARLRSLCRELAFYETYRAYAAPLRQAGLSFCCPTVSEQGQVRLEGSFDLLLAGETGGAVPNDFFCGPTERCFTVTGANQGGKTTYARMVGQCFYLAALGVPIPGRAAVLFPWDRIETHFERQEHVATEQGKLMDDLTRMRGILDRVTDHSLVLLNETFSSTTAADAAWLARQILCKLRERGCLCLYVTFLDDKLRLEGVVNLKTVVLPDGTRTYRVERREPDGRAYALTLARKHHLLYEQITGRLEP